MGDGHNYVIERIRSSIAMSNFQLKRIDLLVPKLLIRFLRRCLNSIALHRANPDSICIIRPGGLGDLVCACVALENINLDPRKYFWILEKRNSSWARYLGLSYIEYDSATKFELMKLWSKFAIVINSEQYFGLSSVFASFLRSRSGNIFLFNTNRGWSSSDQTIEYDPYDTHETLCFEKLFSKSLSQIGLNKLTTRVRKTPTRNYTLIAISGFNQSSRALANSFWEGLIESSGQKTDVIICFAPEDEPFVRKFRNTTSPKTQFIKTDSLVNLISLIQSADLVKTVDSGVVHLCSYFGIPVIAYFTSGRDKKWAPLSIESKVIRRVDLACQPCALFGQTPKCENSFACKDFSKADTFEI